MDCHQVKPALLDYLFEETSAEERKEVERHLQDCGVCSQEMAELQQTMGLLVRSNRSEDIPRRIRLVAESAGSWVAFWRNPARLAFASAGLLCLAIAMLALSRATVSYQKGSFQIAFGVPAGAPSESRVPVTMPVASVARPLDRAQVSDMISEAIAASHVELQRQSGLLARDVSRQMEERWQRDLQEMAASLRYFQSAQTMMWKEQLQNQQLVSTLMHQAGLTAPAPQ